MRSAATLRRPLRQRLRPGRVAAALAPSPRQRRWLLAALAAALVLGSLYMLWFRDSSFVRVEQVSIQGARGAEAARMREALAGAARDMTTLHVDRDALKRAAAGFSSVRRLEVSADFPHTLRITVIEHRPVAIALGDATRVPVGADGGVLRGLPTDGPLPTVRLSRPSRSARLEDAAALRLVRVAGGAPAALAHRLAEVGEKRGRGIVVRLRAGPELIFGDAGRVRAKWLAAARVLADPTARGASYVDVRLPERPAAGGLAAGGQPAAQAQLSPGALPTAPTPGTQAGGAPANPQP